MDETKKKPHIRPAETAYGCIPMKDYDVTYDLPKASVMFCREPTVQYDARKKTRRKKK